MGTICIIIAILTTVFVLITGQSSDQLIALDMPYLKNTYQISFLILSLTIYALGIFSGVLLMLSSFFDAAGRYSKLKKQYEKTNIGAEDAEDKIQLLENKIKTLETALKNSIENKQ